MRTHPRRSAPPAIVLLKGETVGETNEHAQLKRLGVATLLRLGFPAAAVEVRCPSSRYRADVAGYADTIPVWQSQADTDATPPSLFADLGPAPPPGPLPEPRTVIIECKRDRADFLRDTGDLAALLAKREALETRRERIERERLVHEEPHLRRTGAYLFHDLEAWDFTKSACGAYRAVLRELRALERAIYGHTKFTMMARYAIADRLYVLAPRGMVQPRELPTVWGLMECPNASAKGRPKPWESLLETEVTVVSRSAHHWPRAPVRTRLLRNIAVAATREASRKSNS